MKKILKSTIKNLLTVSILLPLSVSATCIITTENFSSQSKVIYVNEFNGSDSLAKVYEGGQVNNPYEPSSSVYAFQTIDKALSLRDQTRGDIILLRRGSKWVEQDVWESNSLNKFNQQAEKAQKYSRQQCEANNLTWVTPRTKPDTEQTPTTATTISVPEEVVAAAATIDNTKQSNNESGKTDNQNLQQTETISRSSGGTSSGGSASGGDNTGNRANNDPENLSLGDNQTQNQFDGRKLANNSTSSTNQKPVSSETINNNDDVFNDDENIEVVENVPVIDEPINNDNSEETSEPNNQAEETVEPNEPEEVVTIPPVQNVQMCSVNADWENQISQYPKDKNGWSIIKPDSETRIMYVSSTDGNDNYARPYLSAENPDPFNPGSVNAYKTIEKAQSEVRWGKPDWILLKNGDQFEITKELRLPPGKSQNAHFVLATYGPDKKRPVIDTNNSSGIILTRSLSYITVAGIEFYPSGFDPASPKFMGWSNLPTNSNHGFASVSGDDPVYGIHLENNKFSFYNNNITLSGGGIHNNVVVRRNQIVNAYSANQHSQGLFAGRTNLLMVEENFFDHNGWYRKRKVGEALNTRAEGGATFYNHNAYIGNAVNLVIKNNLFSRSSSIGIKLASNMDKSKGINTVVAKNHLIENNVFIEGEVGISAGGNVDFGNGYRWQNMNIVNNVFSNIGRTQPTLRQVAYHIDIDDWDGGKVCSNLLADQSESLNNISAIKVSGINQNIEIAGNNVINLGVSTQNFSNETITSNENLYIAKISNQNFLDKYIQDSAFSNYESYINYQVKRLTDNNTQFFDVNTIMSSLISQSQTTMTQFKDSDNK